MKDTFMLQDLASPFSPVGSSMTFGVSMRMESSKSFSCPPFIYYALKAKMLASHKRHDESKLTPRETEAVRMLTQSMRGTAKQLYSDLQSQSVNMEHYMSTYLQDVFLRQLLNEPPDSFILHEVPPAISINVTRAQKNITLPHYLMSRLETLMGSMLAARKLVHDTTFAIKKELEEAGVLNEKGKPIGPAANSSWSRKVHNKLFLLLVEMSSIPELSTKPGIFDIKLLREVKRETTSGKS